MMKESSYEAQILSKFEDKKIDAVVFYIKLPIGKYLEFVREEDLDIQRRFLGARLYQRLIADILQGAVIPPIATIGKNIEENSDKLIFYQSSTLAILDGLQRTYCFKIVEDILRKKERSQFYKLLKNHIPDFSLKDIKFKDVEDFKNNYEIMVEVWLNMDLKKTLYKMIVLNTGQRKMSLEHQLDILSLELKKILEKLNIKALTEKEIKEYFSQKEIEQNGFIKLHVVTEGVVSYLKRSPTKNRQDAVMFLFERLDSFEEALSPHLIEDLEFLFKRIHSHFKYQENDNQQKYILSSYDPVLISLMAAIGKARKYLSEDKFYSRLEALSKTDINWTLFFYYYKKFKSAIGLRRRKFSFTIFWKFLKGDFENLAEKDIFEETYFEVG